MKVIDIHVHAFPDAIVNRAMESLKEAGHVEAELDGSVGGVLRSMDEAGVDASVVCSIATKPAQFRPILDWSKGIASDKLLPFPSVHPEDPLALERIGEIHGAGFKGVKLHPYYQGFVLDEPRMMPLYLRMAELGLVLLCHTGFDLCYPRDRVCDPERIVRVLDAVPGLKFVATHFGAWMDWGEVRRLLLGRPVLMDISYSLQFMEGDEGREILENHPEDCLLFGTDSPWESPATLLRRLEAFGLGERRKRKLLCENAARVLGV